MPLLGLVNCTNFENCISVIPVGVIGDLNNPPPNVVTHISLLWKKTLSGCLNGKFWSRWKLGLVVFIPVAFHKPDVSVVIHASPLLDGWKLMELTRSTLLKILVQLCPRPGVLCGICGINHNVLGVIHHSCIASVTPGCAACG
jgi:hypothetical protein